MNEPEDNHITPELGPEFWKNAERGKYYYKMRCAALQKELEDSALLTPDVRAAFPTDAVNNALRRLMRQNETAPQTEETPPPAVI